MIITIIIIVLLICPFFCLFLLVRTSGGNTTSGSVTSATTTSTQVDRSMLREARDLLQLVLKYTKYTNGIDGLFMDELSSVIEKKCMHKRLERWVTDKMTNDFQVRLIIKKRSETNGGKKSTLFNLS